MLCYGYGALSGYHLGFEMLTQRAHTVLQAQCGFRNARAARLCYIMAMARAPVELRNAHAARLCYVTTMTRGAGNV